METIIIILLIIETIFFLFAIALMFGGIYNLQKDIKKLNADLKKHFGETVYPKLIDVKMFKN